MQRSQVVALLILLAGSRIHYGQAYSDDPRLKFVPKPLIAALEKYSKLHMYNAGEPFYFVGDFDGDGKRDYVMRITSSEGSKGLFFLLSTKQTEYILGCGHHTDISNDFSFTDWSLFRRWQPILNGPNSLAPHPDGDFLKLTWGDTGSYELCWYKGKFVRYGGD